MAFCSDICLLSGSTYTCACPQDKELSNDKHTCKGNFSETIVVVDVVVRLFCFVATKRKQELVVGTKSTLVRIEHQLLGKHDITALPSVVKNIGGLAFDDVNNTLFISDNTAKIIVQLDLNTGHSEMINLGGPIGNVESLSFGNQKITSEEHL